MTDQQLWLDMRNGDKTSLRAIYEREFEYLVQYGIKLCRDQSIVEDAIHDLFVHIWQNRENLGSTDNIRGYLIVSLKRRILKSIKEVQKKAEIEDKEDYYFEAELSIEDVLIGKENTNLMHERLKKAWEELSSREQEAIYLKYYESMDYEEICETMDIGYQSVRNLVFKGIKKLKNLIAVIIFLMILLCF